ncbi:WXG100-like domain-containing protein [Microbacterium tumbae]
MGMMLPDELIWVMDKLGLDWPDIDEDEVRKAAVYVRGYRDDMETLVQTADRRINGEIAAALQGQAGAAHVNGWNRNRSENVQQLLDLLGPAAVGIDIAAEIVLALKIKVIVEITATLIQLIPLLAAGPLGAGGAALLILARKKLFSIAMELTLEKVLDEVLPLAVEPLANQVPVLVAALLDSPVVEGTVGDVDDFFADLEALDQAAEDMDAHAADVEDLTDRLLADLANLQITGD